ncbi:type IV-A pilus assembly ATPase PilB [Enterovibrio norvegicus]|uniref:type IV-A pilus assembly ATPase PilB n=1 Tax=Enterovibrio norvegicus TaxID=188144 RepID=UPI000C82769D|nr:type IV-A pilus assembly ATPase PilB [Enterovibrio norvegicus]MCC4799588.1 type IV-A pilus assembly ATPase PilB [Enterovibrio norvegicus]PMI31659.1 type IV-A pilus assembly ATPase PilB [Enterovibrio norvegicus]PMI37249.1 type IV-A pilus assembly ATPase PilB [Enterovibrio norvegicus]PMN45979.1 type IV-A pilus assembly ATPase PilB [Enterovibrio norvegicus]TKF16848.1 type IV-A pilus assembly ATPase PilB [Enterovibrio norvegicus]
MKSKLLEVLCQAKYITEAQLQELKTSEEGSVSSPSSSLINYGYLSSKDLAKAISQIFGEDISSVFDFPYENTSASINNKDLILKHQTLPLNLTSQHLYLAVSDLTDLEAQDDFRFATGYQIKPVLVDHQQLTGAIRKLYGKHISSNQSDSQSVSDDDLASLAVLDDNEESDAALNDDAPVSRYIQQVLLDAVRKQASDIHFEPFEHSYQIRFRLDGILQLHSSPPAGISRRLSTRLKILSKLNIAERRIPLDGRMKLTLGDGRSIDMRVSTLPTLFGEKVVLRILDGGSVALDIDALGYNEQQKRDYLTALDRPQGMILMTGPTGSGKTVSLYTGLKYLNTPERNISTAEDPVEINLPGINQVSVNNDISLSFATALRAFLRQDPDVVMVGEIRDLETAEIGIKASQTGHLVLSTLHTNSAAESITRLANMGVATYNLASSLSLIIAQRLARRLCQHCKMPHDNDDHRLLSLAQHYPSLKADHVFDARPEGCDHCNHGYIGRVGIYEVMPITRQIAEAIGRGASSSELENLAVENGMSTLQTSGIEKLNTGVTSLRELQRVISI